MISYNENNYCVITFPEHGVLMYARKFMKDDSWDVPSHVKNPGHTVSISILPKGSLRTLNTSREDPVDIYAEPGLIFGGLMLPGTYTLVGLEDDTEYVCLTRHMYGQQQDFQYTYDGWDYHLDNATLTDENLQVQVSHGPKTTLVVCLWGSAVAESNMREPVHVSVGEGIELLEGETLTFTRENGVEFVELAWATELPQSG